MTTTTATDSPRSIPLRAILLFDAATCLAMGTGLVAASVPIAVSLGLPPELLFWAGVALFPCAALMLLAARARPSSPLLWLVINGNVAWAAASVLVATVLFDPTPLGQAIVIAQALAVLVLAWLEFNGWRRAVDRDL